MSKQRRYSAEFKLDAVDGPGTDEKYSLLRGPHWI
jgi:hypothetical protein